MTRLRVGLTGGIGSGKSSVSRLLAARGAVVIDSDVLAREVVARGTPGLASVVDAFGPEVADRRRQPGPAGDGRARLRRSGGARHAGGDHPSRWSAPEPTEIEESAGPDAVVVHDIPLLVETGQSDRFDVVVVVDVAPDTQLDRLVRLRGMTLEEATGRINAQASREQRLAVADQVITNDGPSPTWQPPSTAFGTPSPLLPDSSPRPRRDLREVPGPSGPGNHEVPAFRGDFMAAVGQAARSGSASLRSVARASRSSWRTRSAETPCRAPMSASFSWRPSVRP